jgi:hypothetical protein
VFWFLKPGLSFPNPDRPGLFYDVSPWLLAMIPIHSAKNCAGALRGKCNKLAAWSLLVGVFFLLLGCSRSAKSAAVIDSNAAAFAAPTELTATLADPIDIDLKWKANTTRAGGYLVEYSPNADNEFITIAAVPAGVTTYRHPNLIPQTRFVFHVLPYFGEPSNVAEITTGKKGPQQAPKTERSDKAAQPASSAEPKYSIRSASSLAQAAPTDLQATLIPPAGVKLDWKNHAKDEDGYILEIKSDPNSDFRVSAFLDPGTSMLTTYNLPNDSRISFRVRAFFYGKPSNLAEQTTGRDPSLQIGDPPSQQPKARKER